MGGADWVMPLSENVSLVVLVEDHCFPKGGASCLCNSRTVTLEWESELCWDSKLCWEASESPLLFLWGIYSRSE